MEEKNKNSYLKNIKDAFSTLKKGMGLTMDHARGQHRLSGGSNPVWSDDYLKPGKEHFTLKYPYEEFQIPDHGRYKLDNEIEDCIVCDKCAKVCPVDCIDIEPIRSPEVFGHTSDGTPKRIHAAKFDIDMAKCCFCGLCTTVCPTECLTMTPEYDFSAFDFAEHNVSFAEMTPLQILEAKQKWQEYEKAKEVEKEAKTAASADKASKPASNVPKAGGEQASAKPAFRPNVKPSSDSDAKASEKQKEESGSKPVFRPKVKPKLQSTEESGADSAFASEKQATSEKAGEKPRFRPKVKPVIKSVDEKPIEPSSEAQKDDAPEKSKAKPKFRPKVKPVIKSSKVKPSDPSSEAQKDDTSEKSKAKPAFRPKIKPRIPSKNKENE